MAGFEVRISDLPGANPLSGIELVPLVQNGVTSTKSVADLVSEAGLGQHIAHADPHPQYAFRVKNNLSATTNPTVTNDSSEGYSPTSRWVNTVTNEFFLCVNDAVGAANWQQATLTLDELGSAALVDTGAGNGLDADLLDGQHGSYYRAWANTTGKPSPTITLGGDATGSVTLSELQGGLLTLTVVDDSHNHTIANVDGLQNTLDNKFDKTGGTVSGDVTVSGLGGPVQLRVEADSDNVTETDTATIVLSQDGGNTTGEWGFDATTSIMYLEQETLNAALDLRTNGGNVLLNGSRVFADTYHPNADKLTTARTITLGGDLTGSVSFDGSANVTLSGQVVDDSHNHTIANVDGLQTALDNKLDDTATAVNSQLLDNLDSTQFLRSDQSDEMTGTLTVNGTVLSKTVASSWALQGSTTTGNQSGIWFSGDNAQLLLRDSAGNVGATINAGGASTLTGTLTASAFTGNGANLTALNATQLTTGTVDDARLPASITSDITGNAATATKLATARTISLGGDLSGSANFDGTANITITGVVADDSHNHTIANVDGLQAALNTKVESVNGKTTNSITLVTDDISEDATPVNLWYTDARARNAISVSGDLSYNALTGVVSFSETYSTPTELLTAIKTVDGAASGLDADLLDGQSSAYYQNASNLNAGTLPAARFTNTSHGNRSGGSLHSAVTTTTNGFMTSTDKTKLNGIESGATADQTKADIDALGIDAETLDDLNSTQFVRSDQGDILSGQYRIDFNTSSPTYNTGQLELRTTDGSDASLGFHRSGNTAAQLRHESNGLILSGSTRTNSANFQVTGNISADGIFSGNGSGLTSLNASNLSSGTLPAARFNDTAHGSRSGGTLHAAVTTTTNGFMTSTDKTKLNGIESGATADQTKADIDALGIDAETLDNLNSTQFVRSDQGDSLTGNYSISGNLTLVGDLKMSGSDPFIWTPNTTSGFTGIWDTVNSDVVFSYQNDEGVTKFRKPLAHTTQAGTEGCRVEYNATSKSLEYNFF